MCFKVVLFCFNLTTKVAGGNPRPQALSDNPGLIFGILRYTGDVSSNTQMNF